MKKYGKFLILTFTSVLLMSSSCQNEENALGDLQNEEKIFESIKETHPDISKDDVCISEVSNFEKLFAVGYFAHDRGCALEFYVYNGHQVESSDLDSKLILENNGFENDPEGTIGKYHEYVLNHFYSHMKNEHDNFSKGSYSFEKPKVIKEGSNYISTAWIKKPSGMAMEDSFYMSTATFSKDGKFITKERSNNFTVPMK